MFAAFRGDTAALAASFAEARSHFQKHADVTDPSDISALCAEGRDAAQFLLSSVVQGKLNERGNFGALPQAET